ncbi:MAG: SDR family oxidoreductase [Planctomycetes bacterium]|nr:SDR family oxidoreductase [Planctomycetota bacterium]
MKQTYFVTGALGCIGAWVVKQLLERGDVPVVFDLGGDPRRIRDLLGEAGLAKVRFVQGDITELESVKRAVLEAKPHALVHLAGLQVPFCKADPALGARVNVLGTIHVFEAALAAGLARVVYASSAAVLGPSEDDEHPADEHAPCEPVTHYGVYKRANEGTARIYWLDKKLSSVGLRPLTVYGVGRDQGLTSGPTSAMKAAVLGRPFHIGFSGPTDFHYVADTAAAFLACADRGPAGAHVFNLHGDTLDVAEFVRAIEAELPAARGTLTHGGPRIPIPPRLDGSAIDEAVPGLVHTSVASGVRETLARLRVLAERGALDARDLA